MILLYIFFAVVIFFLLFTIFYLKYKKEHFFTDISSEGKTLVSSVKNKTDLFKTLYTELEKDKTNNLLQNTKLYIDNENIQDSIIEINKLSNNITNAIDCSEPNYLTIIDDNINCISCPTGAYCKGGKKISCGKGKFGKTNNSSDPNICQNCPAGTYNDTDEASSCKKCQAGTYSDTSGSSSCKQCEPGKYQWNIGKDSCIGCGSGTFQSQYGGKTCDICKVGTYSSDLASSCTNCPIGTYGLYNINNNPNTYCAPCSPGTYTSKEGLTVCDLCPIGTYTSSSGSSKCELCPIGTYTSSEGSTECLYKFPYLVAVGAGSISNEQNNSIQYSIDNGNTWIRSDNNIPSDPNKTQTEFFQTFGTAVCYDEKNDIFVASGSGYDNKFISGKSIFNIRSLCYSKDGKTWTSGQNSDSTKGINIFENYSIPGDNSVYSGYARCIATNNNGTIVAGGTSANKTIAYSKDGGKTWTISVNCPYFPKGNGVLGICSDGSGFIAVGTDNNTGAVIVYSIDGGINWSKAKIPDGIISLTSVCYNGIDTFVAIGYSTTNKNSSIIYSKDGKEWIGVENSFYIFQSPGQVCWDGKKFIAVGNAATTSVIVYSIDGINWNTSYSSSNNTENSGFFVLNTFDNILGVYWSGSKLFIYGSNKQPIIMIDDISPTKITYSQNNINIISSSIKGMCSKYVPSLNPVIQYNSLQNYTNISDVTRNFVLDFANKKNTDGAPTITELYNNVPLDLLLKPQDKLYDTVNNWTPKWNGEFASDRNPGLAEYPDIKDDIINTDRIDIIKKSNPDIATFLKVKVPVYVLKYDFTVLVSINSLIIKNGLLDIPSSTISGENSNYYPNRIYIYMITRNRADIKVTRINSYTNLKYTSENQILNLNNNYKIDKNTYLYVVLYNDSDCQPLQTYNYSYGLSLRNLYFEGSPISGYRYEKAEADTKTGGTYINEKEAKTEKPQMKCTRVFTDPTYSDRNCTILI